MPFIEDDPDAFNLAKDIMTLAKNRKLQIVAEYCLNSRIYDAVVQLGADYLQGFYIELPDSNIRRVLQNHGKASC